jgi:hypothetical protein
MPKAGRTGQRILKIVHVFFAALWVGGAITLNAALLLLGPPESAGELLGYNRAAILIDNAVIIPGAMGSLLSGAAVSWLTHWGFFRHRWVAVKLVLTVVCIVVGIAILGPTVNGQPAITQELGVAALGDPAYRANYVNSLLGGAFQLTAILFMLSISTLKPGLGAGKGRAGAPAGRGPSGTGEG